MAHTNPLSVEFSAWIIHDPYSAWPADIVNPVVGIRFSPMGNGNILVCISVFVAEGTKIPKRLFCERTSNVSKKGNNGGPVRR